MPVKILYREKNLMRFYHKEKIDNKRNIYLLGHKVFSYTKSSNVGITPIYDDENAIFRTSFWNKEQEALVNLPKTKITPHLSPIYSIKILNLTLIRGGKLSLLR